MDISVVNPAYPSNGIDWLETIQKRYPSETIDEDKESKSKRDEYTQSGKDHSRDSSAL